MSHKSPAEKTTELKKSTCALAQTRTSCHRTECPSIRTPKIAKILGVWLECEIISIEPLLKHKLYPLQTRTLVHFSGRQWYRLPWIFLRQYPFPHQCSGFHMERGSGPGKVSGEADQRSVWGAEWLGCGARRRCHLAWGPQNSWMVLNKHCLTLFLMFPPLILPTLGQIPPSSSYGPSRAVRRHWGHQPTWLPLREKSLSFCSQHQPPLGLNTGQRTPTISQPSPAWVLAMVSSLHLALPAYHASEI